MKSIDEKTFKLFCFFDADRSMRTLITFGKFYGPSQAFQHTLKELSLDDLFACARVYGLLRNSSLIPTECNKNERQWESQVRLVSVALKHHFNSWHETKDVVSDEYNKHMLSSSDMEEVNMFCSNLNSKLDDPAVKGVCVGLRITKTEATLHILTSPSGEVSIPEMILNVSSIGRKVAKKKKK